MLLNQETLRFIFGIKLRNLRLERKYSLKILAKSSGLSPSYINEIEKGKKYPKNDKILLLAKSLGVSYEDLISIQLTDELNSISKILQGDLIKNIPFDIFGLPAQNIFEMVAESPNEFSALIGSFLELARMYDIRVEDFFYASIRAYLDRNLNWIETLENEASVAREKIDLDDADSTLYILRKYAKEKLKLGISEKPFVNRVIRNLHYVRSAENILYINKELSNREKAFIYAREIGFSIMKLRELPQSSNMKAVDDFEQVFNNFKGSYFASSLLIPAEALKQKISSLFGENPFQLNQFKDIMLSFQGTIDNSFHRLSQIIPHFFGLNRLFLLKMTFSKSRNKFDLTRELHLSNLHSPHGVKSDYHYCRRWITTALINQCDGRSPVAGCQISSFQGKDQEYLCLSMAYAAEVNSDEIVAITLGIELNEKARDQIHFIQDPQIEKKTVSSTCELCQIEDCKQRVANPLPNQEDENERVLQNAISELASH